MRELETRRWSDDDKELIDWFNKLSMDCWPIIPFELDQGRRVISEQFFISLKEQINIGVDGGRARTGALQHDLSLLKNIIEKKMKGE